MLAQERIQAVGQAKELDRVQRALGGSVLHLDPAGAALGRADVDVAMAETLDQATTGSDRIPEAIPGQPVGPAHARAATVDELDVKLWDLAEKVETGRTHI